MIRAVQLISLFLIPLALFAGVVAYSAGSGSRGAAYDYIVRLDLPPANRPRDLPPILGPQDASRPLVVIDAGHGGFDPGAGAGPLKEKTVALAIALALRDALLRQGGIRVATTRDDDSFISLPERPDIARRLGADLFVSIHADSAEAGDARGASVYVLSDKGSSEAAARFAARENKADTVNGVSLSHTSADVGAILLDLSQRDALERSNEAAQLLLRELDGQVPLHRDHPEAAALAVLKAPDIPSILIETGYISSPEDTRMLASKQGRAAIAQAAAQAIRVFFARRAGTAPASAP